MIGKPRCDLGVKGSDLTAWGVVRPPGYSDAYKLVGDFVKLSRLVNKLSDPISLLHQFDTSVNLVNL